MQSRGFINFIGFTGNALELPARSACISGGARLDNPQHLRTESYSLFAQSTHKVSRELTITAGARYEYNSRRWIRAIGPTSTTCRPAA